MTTKKGMMVPGYLENDTVNRHQYRAKRHAQKEFAGYKGSKAVGTDSNSIPCGFIVSVAKSTIAWMQSVLLDMS